MKKIKTTDKLNIIGKNIRKFRKERGISQALLSAKLELIPMYICRGSISRIENGERAVTDIEIAAICKVLQITPNDLFEIKAQ